MGNMAVYIVPNGDRQRGTDFGNPPVRRAASDEVQGEAGKDWTTLTATKARAVKEGKRLPGMRFDKPDLRATLRAA